MGFRTLSIVRYFKLENTTFRKLDLFPSSGEGRRLTLLGRLERADLNHWTIFFEVQVKIRVTLRLAVYRQSVPLGAKPLETHDQRFFSTEPLRS
jgi:hypothetical protein